MYVSNISTCLICNVSNILCAPKVKSNDNIDLKSQRLKCHGASHALTTALAFSPAISGIEYLAVGDCDGTITLFEMKGTDISSWKAQMQPITRPGKTINALAFSFSGPYLAIAEQVPLYPTHPPYPTCVLVCSRTRNNMMRLSYSRGAAAFVGTHVFHLGER